MKLSNTKIKRQINIIFSKILIKREYHLIYFYKKKSIS